MRPPLRLICLTGLSLVARGFQHVSRPIHMSAAAAGSSGSEKEKVVVVGGGIIGASIAYHLSLKGYKPTVIERTEIAAAASGKAGGFLAGGWGDGSVTQQLHRVSFDLHEQLAQTLGVESYRKIPTLSVRQAGGRRGSGGSSGGPSWLDGAVRHELMDPGTAQVTPMELTTKMMDAAIARGAKVIIGTVEGLEGAEQGAVTAVKIEGREPEPCDKVVIAMGPWSTVASDWLGVPIPMQGIKSTSVVYDDCEPVRTEPFALFCAEDSNGCHLEVYPRPNGEVYICGLGGSDYVDEQRLKPGGDCDRQEKIKADPRRVTAASKSFGGMSSLAADREPSSQACMRPCPPDALPILGAVPSCPNAYLACGHNCWGILWSPVTGVVMAELIADGRAKTVNIEPFTVERFMTTQKKRGRKMKDAEVGEQW